jgi:hypothetical protein
MSESNQHILFLCPAETIHILELQQWLRGRSEPIARDTAQQIVDTFNRFLGKSLPIFALTNQEHVILINIGHTIQERLKRLIQARKSRESLLDTIMCKRSGYQGVG